MIIVASTDSALQAPNENKHIPNPPSIAGITIKPPMGPSLVSSGKPSTGPTDCGNGYLKPPLRTSLLRGRVTERSSGRANEDENGHKKSKHSGEAKDRGRQAAKQDQR